MRPLLDPGLFDLEPGKSWVMHCSDGILPRASSAAAHDVLARKAQPWRLRIQEEYVGLPDAARREAAALLGASAPDITLTPTTSSGLVALAQGYPWEAGDEVVVPLGEFPTNAWPWKALAARGVGFREVSLWDGHTSGQAAWNSAPPRATDEPEQRLLDALGPRTRLLSVSWVRFQDGLTLDIPTLARGCAVRGVDLVVDGIQGAGTQPIDLRGVSAFATGAHKGLLAIHGQGFLWTDETFRLRLVPAGSWLSVQESWDFARASTDLERDWLRDGRRLEQGVPNIVGCAALMTSLRMLNGVGMEAIRRHIHALQGMLLDGLDRLDAWKAEAARLRPLWSVGRLGSFLSLHHGARGPDGLNALVQTGPQRGVFATVREGYLRIAFHGFHGGEDVARVLAWLGR